MSEQWLVLYSVPKLPKCKIFEGRKVVDELDIFNKIKIKTLKYTDPILVKGVGNYLYILVASRHAQNNDSKIIKYNMDLEKIETEYNINSCAIQYDVVGNKLYIVNFDDEIVEYTMEKDKLTEKNRTEVEVDDNEYISAMYAK